MVSSLSHVLTVHDAAGEGDRRLGALRVRIERGDELMMSIEEMVGMDAAYVRLRLGPSRVCASFDRCGRSSGQLDMEDVLLSASETSLFSLLSHLLHSFRLVEIL